tara:strand:+ start:695 stop:835 length:141 start_codon:yes stop_codon:yes gene_type:complete
MKDLERLRKEVDRATIQVAEAIESFRVANELYLAELKINKWNDKTN